MSSSTPVESITPLSSSDWLSEMSASARKRKFSAMNSRTLGRNLWVIDGRSTLEMNFAGLRIWESDARHGGRPWHRRLNLLLNAIVKTLQSRHRLPPPNVDAFVPK